MDDLRERIAKRLDKYENFIELSFGALLVVAFALVVISILSSLTDFSATSGFYTAEAVVAFMASFLSLTLIADAFKLSIINFTERQRMKTIFTIGVVGMITNILVSTRLSENVLESVMSLGAFVILLSISAVGYYTVDRYGFSDF